MTNATYNTPAGCPGCSNTGSTPTSVRPIVRCDGCGGYIGDIYTNADEVEMAINAKLVGIRKPMQADGDPERQRYFDFSFYRESGARRIHGWFDADTGRVTQIG